MPDAMEERGQPVRPGYRPDIDGLRAVAVMVVVLFHLDERLMPAGFLGVDVFFVISGFLITGKIVVDLNAGSFSLAEFYRRRIKRIFPVMFTAIAATMIVGMFILLPEDLSALAKSALASSLFAANIHFTYAIDTSYFADSSSLLPLLHLWSLGVEEQFYLVWPLALISTRRIRPIPRALLVGAVAVGSIALGEALIDEHPLFAYYMLPTRAAELLFGTIAFSATRRFAAVPVLAAEIADLIAAVALAYSFTVMTAEDGFPGLHIVPATVATAWILYSGAERRGVVIRRLLATRPFVLIGLISYSLYLWHWPVVAYYRYLFGPPGLVEGASCFAVMVVLSIVSYRMIEQPFRASTASFRRLVVRQYAMPTAIMVAVGGALVYSDGYGLHAVIGDYADRARELQAARAPSKYEFICQRKLLRPEDLNNTDCIINGSDEPKVLLWGDSNGSQYVGLLAELAKARGFSFRNIAHSSCPPILGNSDKYAPRSVREECNRSRSLVMDRLPRYQVVILAGSWDSYYRRDTQFYEVLTATIASLRQRGKRTVMLGKTPRIEKVDRECARKLLKVPFLRCRDRAVAVRENDYEINERLRHYAEQEDAVWYFGVRDLLCPGDRCSAYYENQLVYFDGGHLSTTGSRLLGRAVVETNAIPAFFSQLSRP